MPSHRLQVGAAGRGTHYYQKSRFPVSNLPTKLMLMLEEAWGQLAQLCFSPSYTRNSNQGTHMSVLPWSFYKFLF